MPKKIFQCCSLCGKRLIERKANGLFHFVFGRNQSEPGKPPVEILVHGSVKIRCLRRSCRTQNPDHWNIFHFFPHMVQKDAPNNRVKTEDGEPISSGQAENSGIGKNTN